MLGYPECLAQNSVPRTWPRESQRTLAMNLLDLLSIPYALGGWFQEAFPGNILLGMSFSPLSFNGNY